MRGKEIESNRDAIAHRITPAHAGKRKSEFGAMISHEDHPRACGEKDKSRVKVIPAQGSPPRMRGKAVIFITLNSINRITPAHAGKRARKPPRLAITQDHPRACGEKFMAISAIQPMPGSPPRMRGKGRSASIIC